MIANDEELKITQQRIAHLQDWLAQIRRNARPQEFQAVVSGYRLEIERMQAEILEYLLRPLPSVQKEQRAEGVQV
jgi:hypothetical protein